MCSSRRVLLVRCPASGRPWRPRSLRVNTAGPVASQSPHGLHTWHHPDLTSLVLSRTGSRLIPPLCPTPGALHRRACLQCLSARPPNAAPPHQPPQAPDNRLSPMHAPSSPLTNRLSCCCPHLPDPLVQLCSRSSVNVS